MLDIQYVPALFLIDARSTVHPTDTALNPSFSLLIKYDNSVYRIFLSEEGVTRFKFKQPHHISTDGPELKNDHITVLNVSETENTLADNLTLSIDTTSHKILAGKYNFVQAYPVWAYPLFIWTFCITCLLAFLITKK